VLIAITTGFMTYWATVSFPLSVIATGVSFAGSVTFLKDFIK
jgi:hypothetical protein